MAVAVGHHHLPGMGETACLNRRCMFGSFPHQDPYLSLPSPTLFQRSHSTPCFPSSASSNDPIASVKIIGGRAAPGVHALIVETAVAMAFGARLVPAATGLGGAYFLRAPSGGCVAVVKPVVNKKPLAFSRSSIRARETVVREAAAYLLDHASFAGVPPTALIRISHPAFSGGSNLASRIASIQRFVPHDFDAGDLGPSRFSVTSVHRIGIQDVRLFNTDRHAGNLLVQKQSKEKNCIFDEKKLTADLVPIDHGFCLPEVLDDPYFEWLHWPQAAVPLSELETEYVSKLDPFKDAELLRVELPSLREASIRILILCTLFLKRAVDAGLCLADIGGMMTREFCRIEAGESVLEALCNKTEEAIAAESDLDDGDVRHGYERKEFQFALDCKECGLEAADEDVLNIPLLMMSDGNRSLDPWQEEVENEEGRGEGVMVRSVSFSAGELNCESGGMQDSKMISFKSMSEEEWMLFLERFERLLPEALEARKRMEMKQRLGSSCNF